MKQRMILVALALFFVFGGILSFNLFKSFLRKTFVKNYKPPPIAVSVADAKAEVWTPTIPAVGSLTALQGVNVTTEVAGKVVQILFKDGQQVEEGVLLIKLDDSVQQAELKNAIAAQDLAAIGIKRFRPLLIKGAISPYHMDKLKTQLKEAQAQVEEAEANLAHLHIRAPFAGKLGIRQVDLGEFISAGQTIVRLESEGEIYVDFTLSERELGNVFIGQELTMTTDSLPGQTFTGKVIAISPNIDEATRSFSVRGAFSNKDNILTPGLFAKVDVHLKANKNVITVPKTAVSYSLYGDTMYVLTEPKKKKKKSVYTVKRVSVKPGMERADQVAILEGIKANDQVVTSGQVKLENGTRVTIKDDPLKPPETMPLD